MNGVFIRDHLTFGCPTPKVILSFDFLHLFSSLSFFLLVPFNVFIFHGSNLYVEHFPCASLQHCLLRANRHSCKKRQKKIVYSFQYWQKPLKRGLNCKTNLCLAQENESELNFKAYIDTHLFRIDFIFECCLLFVIEFHFVGHVSIFNSFFISKSFLIFIFFISNHL